MMSRVKSLKVAAVAIALLLTVSAVKKHRQIGKVHLPIAQGVTAGQFG